MTVVGVAGDFKQRLLQETTSTRMMASLLYGVQATDTVTFSGVIGIVGMVATVGSLLPAYRATRVDPMVALNND